MPDFEEAENQPMGILTFRDAFLEALQMWQDGKSRSQILDDLQQLGLSQSSARVVVDMTLDVTYRLKGR